MRVVAALGGNALLTRGEPLTAAAMRANAAVAARSIAEIACDHEVIVTHGNGPQVGLLALQAAAYEGGPEVPLDVLGAESEGMVGYLLEQELANAVPFISLATVLTQVVVDAGDSALARPTKPVGPMMEQAEAERQAAERGWTVARDGSGWRRVVPSPDPYRIVELDAIETLVEARFLVICAGGGGIPVVLNDDGDFQGVEGVVDKDLAAALLATELEADALLLLTDVPGIEAQHGEPGARVVSNATPAELRGLNLPAGSMGPKAEGACRFVEETGGYAAIGQLGDAAAALRGEAGTRISTRVPADPVAR